MPRSVSGLTARTLASALSLFALAQGQGAISGTVSGPDLTGVVVIACLPANGDCDAQQSKAVPAGAGGVYRVEGLGAGPYLILAFRDLNGTGELDAGDEAAVYSRDGKAPAPLRPPQQRIDLRLRPYDGTDASLLAPPVAQTGGTVVGAWSMTGGGTVAVTYTLKPDGTYVYAYRVALTLQSGCTRAGVYTPPHSLLYVTGTYRVAGDRITFTPRAGTYTSDAACNKTERPTSPENLAPKTYAWRLGEYAGSPALFLADAEGERVFYR